MYNGYTFSMLGDGVLLLSDLFTSLEIPANVGDVESVAFTNTALLLPMQVYAGDSLIEKSLISIRSENGVTNGYITIADGVTFLNGITATIPNYKTGRLDITKAVPSAFTEDAASQTFTFEVMFTKKNGNPYQKRAGLRKGRRRVRHQQRKAPGGIVHRRLGAHWL